MLKHKYLPLYLPLFCKANKYFCFNIIIIIVYLNYAFMFKSIILALCFSVPYLGLQLAASGKLFNVLSDGLWGVTTGTWVLAGIVALYVSHGS
jgi:hypothetical protein